MSIPNDDVFVHASKQVNNQVSFIKTDKNVICPNCISSYLQMNRVSSAETKMLALYRQTLKVNKYEWSDLSVIREVHKYVNDIMHLDLFKNEKIYSKLIQPISYREIIVSSIFENYDEIATSVMGVSLPENIHIPYMKPNVLCCPNECIGLIKLPRYNDFIMISKSNFDEISVMEQSLNEMKSICNGEMSSRAGAAGGYMLPSMQCKSLSKVTNNERVLSIRKKSVGMSVSYRNKDGDVKGRNAVYNDLYMARYSATKKFNLVKNSIAMQRLLVEEMISRLRCFILLDHCKVMSIETSLQSFLHTDEKRNSMENQFHSMGKTCLESKLLAWACSTGEMRNHQAVKSHYDKNKSHPVETLSLFGRLPTNIRKFTKEHVEQMQEGYLLLPLEGITIEIKCGYDLIHCSLKKTLHLADTSRNTCNWSRVHGP